MSVPLIEPGQGAQDESNRDGDHPEHTVPAVSQAEIHNPHGDHRHTQECAHRYPLFSSSAAATCKRDYRGIAPGPQLTHDGYRFDSSPALLDNAPRFGMGLVFRATKGSQRPAFRPVSSERGRSGRQHTGMRRR
jgi:hypothetical protein